MICTVAIPKWDNFLIWEKLIDDNGNPVICAKNEDCKKNSNSYVQICSTVFEKYGVDPIDHDDIRNIELIMYGIPGFDNVAQAFLTVF